MKWFLLMLLPVAVQATEIIERVGSCPIGYRTSGGYCIQIEDEDEEVVVKQRSCPRGYRTSGNYCIKLEK
jgi:hypothetical protein